MHLQFKFIKPNKLELLKLPNSNSSFDQIVSSKKVHQYPYENFYTHHTLHTNQKHNFVNNKFSSLFSPSAKIALDFFYLKGQIHKNDPLKDYPSTIPKLSLSHAKLFQHMTLTSLYTINKHHLH